MSIDFATFLFIATLLTGGVWAIDALLFARRRNARQGLQTAAEAAAGGRREPVLVEYCRAFFPVILLVFLLRSFLVEPFRIPSGSMIPTLNVGDFILVNKFIYGIRLPVIDKKVLEVRLPRRGEVVVFRYPPDPRVDYIKRVVGLPGDRVGYYEKVLYINGKPVQMERLATDDFGALDRREVVFEEVFDGARHKVQWMLGRPPQEGEVVVPEGHYFVMGDNRDNSKDSRVWGFVPDANLVGKAFVIWMSWNSDALRVEFKRIGSLIR